MILILKSLTTEAKRGVPCMYYADGTKGNQRPEKESQCGRIAFSFSLRVNG